MCCVLICIVCIDVGVVVFFFFKQKTAYEMRISDWSSDVCSSDLFEVELQKQYFFVNAEEMKVSVSVDNTRGRFPINSITVALVEEIGRASCRERVCQYV